ncbi:MAG: iron-containing alcohol dehydrogenase, partial [Calditrichaeota bacterium]|nr:iron-containing alcohol dehydrogenase [Calditrichota bacterium]
GGLYAELVRAAGLNDTEGESDVEMLIYRVNRLKAAARQPERLQTLNIPRADLPRLAREAAEQWTGKFNPREVGVGELLGIYEMAF